MENIAPSIKKNNFGLSGDPKKAAKTVSDEDYDYIFGLSKSEQKLKKEQKKAEIDRKNAETAAMRQLLSEPENNEESGFGNGKIALLGGLIILLGIGVVLIVKKKSPPPPKTSPKLSAEDLIV